MRDSELMTERALALFNELKRYFPEEDHDYVLTRIEIALLKAHIDVSSNVHTEDDEDE